LKLHGQKSKLDVSQSQKKCVSCYKTLTKAVVRDLCDKCDKELNPILIVKMAPEVTEEKVNMPKQPQDTKHYNLIRTFRCLECSFSTEDDLAMIKHHLNDHITKE
jgi:hypothetical protein